MLVSAALILAGCETTNSIPYKASTSNIISIQQATSAKGLKVSVGDVALAPGVDESPTCRLMGPVKVAPGKTPAQYIKEAFIEELFAAQAYDPKSPNVVTASIDKLVFSSISPASWTIGLKVKSSKSTGGYPAAVDYKFDTSFTAYGACKNVADAFGPAVQELLKQVVTSPGFAELVGSGT
jgi:hypothetical protein